MVKVSDPIIVLLYSWFLSTAHQQTKQPTQPLQIWRWFYNSRFNQEFLKLLQTSRVLCLQAAGSIGRCCYLLTHAILGCRSVLKGKLVADSTAADIGSRFSLCLLTTFFNFLLGMRESTQTFVESASFLWKLKASKICFRLSCHPLQKGSICKQTRQSLTLRTFVDFLPSFLQSSPTILLIPTQDWCTLKLY